MTQIKIRMFKTHSKLKEELAAAETVNAQLESDFTAAQAELADALKAKEELFAKVADLNARAEKAEGLLERWRVIHCDDRRL